MRLFGRVHNRHSVGVHVNIRHRLVVRSFGREVLIPDLLLSSMLGRVHGVHQAELVRIMLLSLPEVVLRRTLQGFLKFSRSFFRAIGSLVNLLVLSGIETERGVCFSLVDVADLVGRDHEARGLSRDVGL